MKVSQHSRSLTRRGAAASARGLFILLALLGVIVARPTWAASPNLVNDFADREVITDDTGRLDGSNAGATRELGEPNHGGKQGGRSVWISWLAPADGIATFSTDGSTFDTLLSAYRFNSPADTTIDRLREVARNDDASVLAAPSSLVQFGAHGGTMYHIAIDGFAGAAGNIRLRWDFANATSPPPVIVSVPDDQAAREGDTVTLAVDMQTSPELKLQWRFNGNSFGQTGPTLTIPALQLTNVGRYTLRIDLGDVRFETRPVELQINSDGQTNALAQDKLLDALNSPLTPDDGDGLLRTAGGPILTAASAGVSRGYNGAQVFNTTFATADPAEPEHCGLNGSASYWYAYQPPADGTLVLDTIGSSFDTFIAVYTFNPPFASYADLIPLTCDDNGAGTNGAALLEFAAPKNRLFLVVIDGINGARGIARLNYRLDTNRPPTAPTLVQAPAPRTVAIGASVAIAPAVAGSPPLHFLWRKGTNLIAGATNSTLALSEITPAQSGEYRVTISSHVGLPLEVPISLRVVTPPQLSLLPQADGRNILSFQGLPGQHYFIEMTDSLGGPWRPLSEELVGDGSSIVLTNDLFFPANFFRVRVE
jgi:hypothetical protein